MTTQEQIQQDVAWASQSNAMQEQLLNFLKGLKAKATAQRNIERVLSHSGTVEDSDADEVTRIINAEFGKVDGEWH